MKASRPSCLAGGGPLERRVRQRSGDRRQGVDGTQAGIETHGCPCANTASLVRADRSRAQEPQTDFHYPRGRSHDGFVCRDWNHSSNGRRADAKTEEFAKTNIIPLRATRRSVQIVRLALRGIQDFDFHARLGRWTWMAQASGALRCLTFELSGHHRRGAWPARRMMPCIASRAKCHAGGGPLERRVRPHLAAKRCTGCGDTPQPGPADAPASRMTNCLVELTSER